MNINLKQLAESKQHCQHYAMKIEVNNKVDPPRYAKTAKTTRESFNWELKNPPADIYS